MTLYPYVKVFQVMKPNVIKDDNDNDHAKLLRILQSPQYEAEQKIDGCHYNCIGGRFFSTHISEITGVPVEKTANFPHIAQAIEFLGWNKILLDGEINYPGKTSQDVTSVTGTTDGDKAIAYQEQHGWVEYRVFDMLRDPDGHWLLNLTWQERRTILDGIAAKMHELCPQIVVNPYVINDKQKFVRDILDNGGEGAVIKRRNGLYIPGKNPKWEWMKIKQHDSEDVVITGFAPPKKAYSGTDYQNWLYWENGDPVSKNYHFGWIGSIKYGKYHNGQLTECGQCGGINEADRKHMTEHPEQYIGKVMQVDFMEKTNAGNNRHCTFVQLHPDKNPFECIM